MYILDETADRTVREHRNIQDVVQGKTAMLWLPGQGAGVAAQGSLTFGWAGTCLAALWLMQFNSQLFMCLILTTLVFAAGLSLTFHAVLRGKPQARTRAYRFSVAMAAVAGSVALFCLARGAKLPLAIAAVGLAFNVLATRLIAGPSYALLSAIFRAQRAHMESVDQVH